MLDVINVYVITDMIVSLGNRDTQALARGLRVARFVAIESVAHRKLR